MRAANDNKRETMIALMTAMVAEGTAIALFLATLTVWIAIWGTA